MKLIVYVTLISLITFRYFATRPVYKDGDRVRITTRVLSQPIRYPNSQYFKIAGLKVYLPPFPEINYGDEIVLEGVVDGKKLKNAKIQNLQESDNVFLELKPRLTSFYQSVLPEPHAGLIAGIILGSKGSLTADFWERAKKTGVAHVVVASGMNVTFVASFLTGVMTAFLPRRKAIVFVILGIILYVFICGLEAPLIRAAIMGSLAFAAQELGRLVSAWRALLLSALIMLVVKPDWIGDIGFTLSFVATASLLAFEPGIRNKLLFLPKFLKEGFSTSLAAQIGVSPILFVTFGQFNILSPIINALVLWTVPLIMLIGAVGGVVGLLVPVLGKLILYLAYPLSWWFGQIISLF